MRHYEVVFLVHPDQSDQVNSMIDRYREIIESFDGDNKGVVHRVEDWGRRQLAYCMKKLRKAHYVLMNIECSDLTLKELTRVFKFNDAVIRNLILRRDSAITEASVILKAKRATEQKQRAAEAYTVRQQAVSASNSDEKLAEVPEVPAEKVVVAETSQTTEEVAADADAQE